MKTFIITLTLALLFNSLQGQIFEKWSYKFDQSYGSRDGALDGYSNYYYFLEKFNGPMVQDSVYLVKEDSTGQIVWQKMILPDTILPDTTDFTFSEVRLRKEGNCITITHGIDNSLLNYFNSSGQLIYQKTFPYSSVIASYLAFDNSTYVSVLEDQTHVLLFYVFDSLGNGLTLDTLHYPGISTDVMEEDKSGNVYLYYIDSLNASVIYRYANHQKADSLIIPNNGSGLFFKTDSIYRYAFGNQIRMYDSNWTLLNTTNIPMVNLAQFDASHNLYVMGVTQNFPISKIDMAGNILWTRNLNFPQQELYESFELLIDTAGYPIVSGRKFDAPGSSNSNKIFISRFSPSGHLDAYYEANAGNIGAPCIDHKNNIYCTVFGDSAQIECISTRTLPTISGNVYYDGNANCQKDTNESGQEGVILFLLPGNYYTSTNYDGSFGFIVPDGSYTLTCITPPNDSATCAPAQLLTVTNGIASVSTDFGIRAQSGINDLAIDVALTPIRQGGPVNFIINYTNLGALTVNGSVHCNYDSIFQFLSAIPLPDSSLPNSLSWNFTYLDPGETRTVVFSMRDVSAAAGAFYQNYFSIDGLGIGDNHPLNNMYLDTGRIIGSFDPNEKFVTPGEGAQGIIHSTDSTLSYHIVFQNTGNDTAFYVQVVDTLDPSLDPSTLRVGVLNPQATWSLQNNTIKFKFDPALIPDSVTDQPNSFGYINYTIRQRPNLQNGTTIKNFADIYFDYNPPVSTNMTLNTFSNVTYVAPVAEGESFCELFPNPSTGRILLRIREGNENESKAIITLTDLSGQNVARGEYAIPPSQLDVSKLNPGIYFFKIQMGNRQQENRLVIIR